MEDSVKYNWDLKVEYVDIDSIKPYENNAKEHPQYQIDQIVESIKSFGMADAIAVWHDEIVEGHGRLMACKQLGMKKIPIVRLDDLSDEERRAYALAHNKLTMNSDFNGKLLEMELNSLDMDMAQFGFFELTLPPVEELEEQPNSEVKDGKDQPLAVRLTFKNTREWKKNEELVRAFADGLEGVNVALERYDGDLEVEDADQQS